MSQNDRVVERQNNQNVSRYFAMSFIYEFVDWPKFDRSTNGLSTKFQLFKQLFDYLEFDYSNNWLFERVYHGYLKIDYQLASYIQNFLEL